MTLSAEHRVELWARMHEHVAGIVAAVLAREADALSEVSREGLTEVLVAMNDLPTRHYLQTIPGPGDVPAGLVVVHNQVRPQPTLGAQGFRAWLDEHDDERLEVCGCGWAPELPEHYRVIRAGGA